jgi:hypothetical protein
MHEQDIIFTVYQRTSLKPVDERLTVVGFQDIVESISRLGLANACASRKQMEVVVSEDRQQLVLMSHGPAEDVGGARSAIHEVAY